jgi:hypothetical protein
MPLFRSPGRPGSPGRTPSLALPEHFRVPPPGGALRHPEIPDGTPGPALILHSVFRRFWARTMRNKL